MLCYIIFQNLWGTIVRIRVERENNFIIKLIFVNSFDNKQTSFRHFRHSFFTLPLLLRFSYTTVFIIHFFVFDVLSLIVCHSKGPTLLQDKHELVTNTQGKLTQIGGKIRQVAFLTCLNYNHLI
jgi:hypothetical protein